MLDRAQHQLSRAPEATTLSHSISLPPLGKLHEDLSKQQPRGDHVDLRLCQQCGSSQQFGPPLVGQILERERDPHCGDWGSSRAHVPAPTPLNYIWSSHQGLLSDLHPSYTLIRRTARPSEMKLATPAKSFCRMNCIMVLLCRKRWGC